MTLPTLVLDWYDRHARALPWRVGPAAWAAGVRPDPYQVWLAEVMLQQTTVAAVAPRYARFLARWPTVTALAAAEDSAVMAEWAGLGYYARARNLIACARAVAAAGGFPDTEAGLRALPGIGAYTAAAVAAIAFDRRAAVVDGNVERVLARLFRVETPLPAAKPELRRLAEMLTPAERPGDYAQALMDLGATVCTPRNPACGLCPWREACRARAAAVQAELPRRALRPARPVRHGLVYLGRDADGRWLVERRPSRGLLGGMLGWPGTVWAEAPASEDPPAAGVWHDPGLEVRHTFTHFHLILSLRLGRVVCVPSRGFLLAPADFRPRDLPSVMRKAYDLAAPHLA